MPGYTKMSTDIAVIPTYNEAGNIVGIVERTLEASPDIDVLIVDDNSPDGTGELADVLALKSPRVFVLHRSGKEGLGTAYLAGFAWAKEAGYRRIAEMDADGSHQPEALPALFELLETYDLALGSRWVAGGRTEDWSRRRQLLSRGGSLYARLALGIRVSDATGGFRAFRAETLEAIDLGAVASEGYCFQIDLLWRTLQAGLKVVEYPIVFRERTRGSSKMSGGIVTEALIQVTRWGLTRRLDSTREFLLHGRRLPSVRDASATIQPVTREVTL
jgi:dolichol-phosphate mannosyltransferase